MRTIESLQSFLSYRREGIKRSKGYVPNDIMITKILLGKWYIILEGDYSMAQQKLINSVDRAMKIIDLFTEKEKELKLTEISQYLNLHKSTVHGLLRTLAHHGYIDQNPETEKYKLGLRFIEKGTLVLNGLDLRRIAQPHLTEMAAKYGETTHLAILEDGEAVYIDKIEGHSAIGMYSRIGKRAPIYCTAVGKILISDKTAEFIEEIANRQSFTIHTVHTVKNKEELIAHIQAAAEQGFALDDEELEVGLRCAAVPIFNNKKEIVASMSISGPTTRLGKEKLGEVIEDLKFHARKISDKLGY
jgi:IclR family transcriptional regulator, KDG regulon repressor